MYYLRSHVKFKFRWRSHFFVWTFWVHSDWEKCIKWQNFIKNCLKFLLCSLTCRKILLCEIPSNSNVNRKLYIFALVTTVESLLNRQRKDITVLFALNCRFYIIEVLRNLLLKLQLAVMYPLMVGYSFHFRDWWR